MSDMDNPAEAFALRYPGNWPSLLNRMVSLAVVPGDAPDTIRTKRLFTTAMWASLLTAVSSISLLLRDDAPLAAAATAIPLLTAAISLVAMWRDPSTYPGVMHLVAGGTIATSSAIIVMFGGIYESAGAATWSMLAVFGAVAIFADRRAHLWLAVFAVSVGTAALLSARFEPLYQVPNPESLAAFNLVVVSLFIYVILYYFVRKSDQLFHQADDLLRNVLPDEVAERLKLSGEGMIADEFESASILFADISGFSSMAADLTPSEVVLLLNEVSPSSTTWWKNAVWRRSRPSETPTWSPPGCPWPETITPGRSVTWPSPCRNVFTPEGSPIGTCRCVSGWRRGR
jgi:hypothetical protein